MPNYRATYFPEIAHRLKRAHGGCYSKTGLPLIDNSSIVAQPLDLWTLTEKYKSAAKRIVEDARYNTAAQKHAVW